MLKRPVVCSLAICSTLFAQGTRPGFTLADIHPTPASESTLWVRPSNDDRNPLYNLPVRDGLLQAKGVTMLDLIAIAYNQEAWAVADGPNWLEYDRFNLIASLPPDTPMEDRRQMLRGLLEERFKLVVREETRPVPGYALIASRHTQLAKASGAEPAGCALEGQKTFTTAVSYRCRNITMDAFADGLLHLNGVFLAPGAVVNATNLKGTWNFDFHWFNQFVYPPSGHMTVSEALRQQLGLTLEERPVPTHALTVVSVNRVPVPSAPAAGRIAALPPPTRFEVASVKASDPHTPAYQARQSRKIESRRLTIANFPMRYLFEMALPHQVISNLQPWTETEGFSIEATLPVGTASLTADNLDAPLLAVLRDRFRLSFHTELRPRPAYNMEAVKPKMLKGDPFRRGGCHRDSAPSSEQGFELRVTCRNVTMSEFGEYLTREGIGLKSGPKIDRTGLTGAWNFTLVYDPNANQPVGEQQELSGGPSVLEAIQRQLGLKLVETTAPAPVIVIDHLDRTPTPQ